MGIRLELWFHFSYGTDGMTGINMMRFCRASCALRAHLLHLAALMVCSVPLLAAADLPKPAAVVYRCDAGGKVVYSDEPCVGARVVDATPNSGVDSLSGHKRVGADVQREQFNRQLGEALRPLGSSPEKFSVDVRRANLPPEARQACSALDRELPRLEHSKASAEEVYQARKRYRDLGC